MSISKNNTILMCILNFHNHLEFSYWHHRNNYIKMNLTPSLHYMSQNVLTHNPHAKHNEVFAFKHDMTISQKHITFKLSKRCNKWNFLRSIVVSFRPPFITKKFQTKSNKYSLQPMPLQFHCFIITWFLSYTSSFKMFKWKEKNHHQQ